MEPIIIILLLIILAELTYVLANNPSKIIKRTERPIFVDTSVLMDGRIIAVAESGFIGDTLYIPRSVIGELQFLADNADHDKRSRARRGLDIVRELQEMDTVTTKIYQDGSKAEEGVDERLLNLAKKHEGAICTIDFNLNKVAQVENIAVLNVNLLAQTLRMAFLPGERAKIEVIQKGQDGHQGVGYLPDGTMVVVEQANKQIGKIVEIEFIRSLQTAAGKMMFAKLVEADKSEKSDKKPAIAPPKQSRGRKPVEQQKPPVKQAQPQQSQQPKPKTKAKTTKSPRPARKHDREDALIELVNRQSD